jgi:hypothetical protein
VARTLELGAEPLRLRVHLTSGADFDQVIVNLDADSAPADWAEGDELHLDIGDTVTWDATLAGAEAAWHVPADDVDSVLAAADQTAALVYTNGDAVQVWASGQVIAHD